MPERRQLMVALLAALVASLMAASCVRMSAIAPSVSLPPVPTIAPIATPAIAGSAVDVPAWVDATGATDASAALQRFVDGVPDGSIIRFAPGGEYRMDHGLVLRRRHDLVFEGNGATLRAQGSARDAMDSVFALMEGDERIAIRDFTLIGNNPDAGTRDAFHGRDEHLHGFYLGGVSDVLIEGITITDFYGDCVYVGTDGDSTWSSNVVFQDSTCTRSGRHGVGYIAGRDITVQRVTFDAIGMWVVDIEPNRPFEGADGFLFRDNTIGTYGLTDQYIVWLVSARAGAEGSVAHDVSIIGNTITGNPASGFDGEPLGLAVYVDGDLGPRSNWVIRDNTSTISMSRTTHGAPIYIRDTDGVIVADNRQPMGRGELGRFPGSTNVIYQDNDTSD